MLFNSLSFALFLPLVFLAYWFVAGKNVRTQNLLLLCASYYFYASWDYRFLFLLMFSTLLDYYTGIKMSGSSSTAKKRFWFLLSIMINVGFLGVFKYYDFFARSFAEFLAKSGLQVNVWTLRVILPVGISFYTFHGISYVIDIYNNRIKPEKNFIDYALFVSYFPLLVAGPIERAMHLLPQLKKKRHFDYSQAVDGLKQMLWGFVKKIVIADTCADYAAPIFAHYDSFGGSTLLLGVFFFSIQIYCDFSGYSDIALGTSRLFGIDLLRNFSFPYFSRDIAEFWRRWHISLTTWFRDYLYIPLGGSRGGRWKQIRNILIIFTVSGFWHGANWTFLVWGVLNAMYFIPLLLLNRNRVNLDTVAENRAFPSIKELGQMLLTFFQVMMAWVFFRSLTVADAVNYIGRIFSPSLFSKPDEMAFNGSSTNYMVGILLIIVFTLIEWYGRKSQYAIQHLAISWNKPARWAIYYLLVFSIFLFIGKEKQFIYFQF
jgi:alginate O-acetyltransferase complex protein AlgI